MLLESDLTVLRDDATVDDTVVQEGFIADYVPLDNSTVLMLGILELLHAEHEQGRGNSCAVRPRCTQPGAGVCAVGAGRGAMV